MKTIYTLVIALLITNSLTAQLNVKETWKRALLTTTHNTITYSTDTIQKSITVFEADSLIDINDTNKHFIILDVRTKDEFIQGHIKNAVNIDYYDSNFNLLIDVLDRDFIYLIYCGVGGRSKNTFNKMVSMHFREVYNMLGGFTKWKTEGFPYEVDTTTGINNNMLFAWQVSIYPNPAISTLNIELNQCNDKVSLTVINSNGQVQLMQILNELSTEIDISNLPTGVYLLQLVYGNRVITRKFIKQ